MKKKLLEVLKKWPKNFITTLDMDIALQTSQNSLHSLIKRFVKDKILIRIKRDLYLISSFIKEEQPNLYVLAPLLYGPSYISFESAISYHGWIPEASYVTTSACVKRTKTFETSIGTFVYTNIPVSMFHIGVSTYKLNNETVFIADPWKAVADLVYVKKKHWTNIIAFSNDMRIELEIIQFSDLVLLSKLANTYPNTRTRKTLTILYKDLNK